MLANLLMTKGSKVAMEDPGYPDARSIFRLAGADTVPTPVDDQGIVTLGDSRTMPASSS